MSAIKNIRAELRKVANPHKIEVLQSFFKTGPGDYGEGDKFLGVIVPKQRKIARQHLDLKLSEIEELLQSPYHEERLTALLILTYQYPKAERSEQAAIYNFYLDHTQYINNWDLVDVTCPKIVGAWLYDHDRSILDELAASENLWERRIAVLACFYFIQQGESADALRLATRLLTDRQDLIHKAVGWMLREVGKKCGENVLKVFLDEYLNRLPRTTLRYAIERLSQEDRRKYLAK